MGQSQILISLHYNISFLLIKNIKKNSSGYKFTICLTKPVKKALKIKVVVIQSKERGCAA